MNWVKIEVDKSGLSWGLMQFTHDETFYIEELNNTIESEILGRKNKKSRLESLAARYALKELLHANKLNYKGLFKDKHEKPQLIDIEGQIAISHSKEFVAVAFHPTKNVGLDIEKWSDRLLRVVPRILSQEEQKTIFLNHENALKIWCAKEALYKLNGTKNIDFTNDITILETSTHSWTAKIPRLTSKVNVDFKELEQFCIATTIE